MFWSSALIVKTTSAANLHFAVSSGTSLDEGWVIGGVIALVLLLLLVGWLLLELLIRKPQRVKFRCGGGSDVC